MSDPKPPSRTALAGAIAGTVASVGLAVGYHLAGNPQTGWAFVAVAGAWALATGVVVWIRRTAKRDGGQS